MSVTAGISRGAGISIFTGEGIVGVFTADTWFASVGGAGVIVVAGNESTTRAYATLAAIIRCTGISIIAFTLDGHVDAALSWNAAACGTWIIIYTV